MEEKKQNEERETYILNAEKLETAVTMFSKETQNYPNFTVDKEEVEKITSAFKGVNSKSAITSISIVATVLAGQEIMFLITIFKKMLLMQW